MSVYRNDKRGTWLCRYRYKDWRGKVINSTKRGFKTKKEAVEWVRTFMVLKAGDLEMTLPEFVKLCEAGKLPRLEESTRVSKRNIIETKLLDVFSTKKMCEIKPSDIINWQNEMLAYRNPKTGKPYSTSYLQAMHTQLSSIFNHACKFYNLSRNPAKTAGNMRGPKGKEMKIWTKDEYKRFSASLSGDPIAFHAFEMLYWIGMRRGEMLALTKADFDFTEQTVRVNKTFHRIKGHDIATPPKTDTSNRTITLQDSVRTEMVDFPSKLYALGENGRIFPLVPSAVSTIMKKAAARQGYSKSVFMTSGTLTFCS